MVLDNIPDEYRNLYWLQDPRKLDYSYAPVVRRRNNRPRRDARVTTSSKMRNLLEAPVSLYSLLARRLNVPAAPTRVDVDYTRQEITLLNRKGFSKDHVHQWIQCLLTGSSVEASLVFRDSHRSTPLFLLLLYLRRKRIRAVALGTVLRHLDVRLRTDPIEWSSLQVLVIRLTRHARSVWPEALPWIATLFCTQANRIYQHAKETASYSSIFLANLTRYCNSLLSLISLPTPKHPMLVGSYQEKAQFILLQFMASCKPALTVTRHGFHGAVSTQLTHVKTAQEKEWAMLKGPTWPPWKENRNAMDEDKGYMYGASRASRLLHRLYEAGYGGGGWENIAEAYAGWDTDLSPTVQTRTNALQISKKTSDAEYKELLWATRIRTTRTRREAWACFLAYEEAESAASQAVYLAMFEKLYYPELEVQEFQNGEILSTKTDASIATKLLPGDMKEVLPDPKSPLHLVYLSEPVPSYSELYHRMWRSNMRPQNRLLAFLLETLPDFSTCLHLLDSTKSRFGGTVEILLQGLPFSDTALASLPDYFFASFIRFLCRFGRLGRMPEDEYVQMLPRDHDQLFRQDSTYLMDYAYALLMQLRPTYLPPWTAYMRKVLYGHGKKRTAESQYPLMCKLFDMMADNDIDPDDEQFQLLCAVARYTAQAAYRGSLSPEFTTYALASAPRRLRTTFHDLVRANVDPNPTHAMFSKTDVPHHIPGPAALHTYVRALGFIRDYEGLYSFTLWLTTHHNEVTVRANAQHGGPKLLFNTFVALRAALEGTLDSRIAHDGAPREIVELVKAKMLGVEGWDWPSEKDLEAYTGTVKRSV